MCSVENTAPLRSLHSLLFFVERCIKRCSRLPDGDYQSCVGCDVYASCVAGRIYNNRPCPEGLHWDDNNKICDNKPSSTCLCKFTTSSATGLA